MATAGPAVKSVNWPKSHEQTKAEAKEDLRGVHWATSFRRLDTTDTEQRHRFKEQPPSASAHDRRIPGRLRDSHIDLAFGCDKSSKGWTSEQSDVLARNMESKFGCKGPEGRKDVALQMRRSNVSLSCGSLLAYETEQRKSFAAPKVEPRFSAPVAAMSKTLGLELRRSSFDIANGQDKTEATWKGVLKSEMSQYARQKYEIEKPKVEEHLMKELRQSSVPLGGVGFRSQPARNK